MNVFIIGWLGAAAFCALLVAGILLTPLWFSGPCILLIGIAWIVVNEDDGPTTKEFVK